MDAARLSEIYPKLAGYTFNLGYRDPATGSYHIRRNLHRPNFPVVSDLPGADLTGSPNHGSGGFNTLFEDGSYRVMTTNVIGNDDIFRNGNRELGSGNDENDAVLVPAEVRAK